MNTDLTTSQKIRIDLRARLRQAEQDNAAKPDLDTQYLIAWLRKKLSFFENGWHKVYEQQNNEAKFPAVQFEREPDEGLL